MIAITKPIKCSSCGSEMGQYSIERIDQLIIFRCKCGNITPITFEKYKSLLQNNELIVR